MLNPSWLLPGVSISILVPSKIEPTTKAPVLCAREIFPTSKLFAVKLPVDKAQALVLGAPAAAARVSILAAVYAFPALFVYLRAFAPLINSPKLVAAVTPA